MGVLYNSDALLPSITPDCVLLLSCCVELMLAPGAVMRLV